MRVTKLYGQLLNSKNGGQKNEGYSNIFKVMKESDYGSEFYVQCNHLSIMRAKQRYFLIKIESIYNQHILTKGNSHIFISSRQ